ncbi:DNA mismatch repair protein [Halobacteriales archaeon QS_3_64_16]|nr:MAG: DNA mismatch repair protein [Halobacteriales archaeon QS_3_64_16]
MNLEDYWGIGPKTRERLEGTLGTERAIEAIESVDIPALTEAGLARGRATRVLRHAHGERGMDLLRTPDTRRVYKDLIDRIAAHALTEEAADRIRVLTPLDSIEAMDARLDDVALARESWAAIDDSTREAVLEAFEEYDAAGGGERAAVAAALSLRAAGVERGAFEPLTDLDRERLAAARDALRYLDGEAVLEGADSDLDALRERRAATDRLASGRTDVLKRIGADELRTTEELREAFIEYATAETGASPARVRAATPQEATDAADFVSGGLRALGTELEEVVAEREHEVRADLENSIADARGEVDAAVETVREITLTLSLARFAAAYDLIRPEFVERECLAVAGARNLALVAGGSDPQPIAYAIGEHTLADADIDADEDGATADTGSDTDLDVPSGDRVAVLTGANSGGKTTLLETLCQVVLLAAMGLPVPAERAQLGRFDSVVFHRRHASFNAGVLESTLRTVVPPLTESERTLMLVDEFEAITEPGSAANLLHGLVGLSVETGALGVFVTHLAEDLEPLPDAARTDGIFAQGLDEDLALDVDYQPRFGAVGRSTPEFIVSRLVANASDRGERAGFSALADAVGQEAVQRTLSDVEWSA